MSSNRNWLDSFKEIANKRYSVTSTWIEKQLKSHPQKNNLSESVSKEIAASEVALKSSALHSSSRVLVNTVLTTTATHSLDVLNLYKVTNLLNDSKSEKPPLFKGFGLNLTTNVLRNSIFFFSIPFVQTQLSKTNLSKNNIPLVAFGFSSVIEGVAWAPINALRVQRMTSSAKTTFELISKLSYCDFYKSTKRSAYWGGLRNAVSAFPYFGMIQAADEELLKESDTLTYKASIKFISGSVAGIISSIPSYPLDFIQKNLTKDPNISLCDFLKSVQKKHGIKGFYTGFDLAMWRMGAYFGAMNVGLLVADKLYHSMLEQKTRRTASPLLATLSFLNDKMGLPVNLQEKDVDEIMSKYTPF